MLGFRDDAYQIRMCSKKTFPPLPQTNRTWKIPRIFNRPIQIPEFIHTRRISSMRILGFPDVNRLKFGWREWINGLKSTTFKSFLFLLKISQPSFVINQIIR